MLLSSMTYTIVKEVILNGNILFFFQTLLNFSQYPQIFLEAGLKDTKYVTQENNTAGFFVNPYKNHYFFYEILFSSSKADKNNSNYTISWNLKENTQENYIHKIPELSLSKNNTFLYKNKSIDLEPKKKFFLRNTGSWTLTPLKENTFKATYSVEFIFNLEAFPFSGTKIGKFFISNILKARVEKIKNSELDKVIKQLLKTSEKKSSAPSQPSISPSEKKSLSSSSL